jgi:hypothetical protein
MSVVLPLPRKPVMMVTGIFAAMWGGGEVREEKDEVLSFAFDGSSEPRRTPERSSRREF